MERLASRGSRLAAALLDGLFGAIPYGLVQFLDLPDALRLLLLGGLLALIGYQVWSTATRGQTIAKRLLGIRIVLQGTSTNGGFVTNVVKRGLISGALNIIPLFFFVDSLFIFREDRRTIHDHIAGTEVIVGQPDAA